MNAVSPPEQAAVDLVDIVGFKWLMAHEGHAVHAQRLQEDAAYARECLALAEQSPTPALRSLAASLRARLHPGDAAADGPAAQSP
jgi:hypothetical protein